jgi:outer membrane lipoprotein SlyB
MSPRRTEERSRRTSKAGESKPAPPTVVQEQAKPPGMPIQGIGAIAGAVVFVVLNVVTDGKVPGGYSAGVIGGGIGWVIGIGIEKLLDRRKK